MKISEIFFSIQGEGKNTGMPTIFLRLALCNLRCKFCDSKYTWRKYKEMTIEKMYREITKYSCKNLVITGGEPLLQQEELFKLVNLLPNWWIEIETNGTIVPDKRLNELIDQYNVSLKMKNSGNKKINKNSINFFLKQNSYFKFVVQKKNDVNEILELVNYYNIDNNKIFLMPEGITKRKITSKKWLIETCKKYRFWYSDRLHIKIWGKKRKV